MSSVAKKTLITPEEYLVYERLAEFKSEYYDGQIDAMAGTSFRHNVIAVNLITELSSRLRAGPCQPTIGDIRLRTDRTGLYTYPDLMVVCGEPQFADDTFDTLLNPTLIIEILSPSTESWDRGGKFAHYRRIESLTDYVLVSQDKILVEHYTRQGEQWLLTAWSQPQDMLSLGSIGCEIPLRDVYAKVSFELG